MITPRETEAGLRAYEQVQAYAALRRRKLGLVYSVFAILLLVSAAVAGFFAARWLGIVCTLSAVVFSTFALWNWRRLRALDVLNRALLAQLETKYGDALPWLEVERQQAEIRRIQSEQDA